MKITRRQFVKMAAYAAAATGVSQFDLTKLQKALAATGDQIPVIWFEGLGDSGCVVSLANYFDEVSGIDSVLLNSIELKFNSVLMGASGQLAIDEAEKVYDGDPPYDQHYVLVVTGGISNLDGYCIVGQDNTNGLMQMMDAFSRWQLGAKYVLFVGACACYGGVNTIRGNYDAVWNPTGQNPALVSPPTHTVAEAYGDIIQLENYDYSKSVFIPGCPAHPDWIVLTIVHLLTDAGPDKIATLNKDSFGRPTTILGSPNLFHETVHENCPRKLQHDLGNFADHVGDTDKCLRKVGCRGKETYCPCPVMGWNNADFYNSGKLAYCTAPGINHLCIGCTEAFFPDVPFNRGINNIDTTP